MRCFRCDDSSGWMFWSVLDVVSIFLWSFMFLWIQQPLNPVKDPTDPTSRQARKPMFEHIGSSSDSIIDQIFAPSIWASIRVPDLFNHSTAATFFWHPASGIRFYGNPISPFEHITSGIGIIHQHLHRQIMDSTDDVFIVHLPVSVNVDLHRRYILLKDHPNTYPDPIPTPTQTQQPKPFPSASKDFFHEGFFPDPNTKAFSMKIFS